jgi:hypothetical protein
VCARLLFASACSRRISTTGQSLHQLHPRSILSTMMSTMTRGRGILNQFVVLGLKVLQFCHFDQVLERGHDPEHAQRYSSAARLAAAAALESLAAQGSSVALVSAAATPLCSSASRPGLLVQGISGGCTGCGHDIAPCRRVRPRRVL